MNKTDFQRLIAEHAYNIGFGAKKHFASYDIIVKLPYWISFVSLAIGIIQVSCYDIIYDKEISIVLILISIAALFLNFFNSSVNDYSRVGAQLTKNFNDLKTLYFKVKDSNSSTFDVELQEMTRIVNDGYNISISKQVFMSQWYAHFKFFYEMQIDWINEELKFQFYRDKVPNSLKPLIFILLLVVFIWVVMQFYHGYSGNI
jgi:hypothetical protein